MKNLVTLLFVFLPLSSFAEIALVCSSDTATAIEENDKAEIHVDFFGRVISNKEDVKFLYFLGNEQPIDAAKMVGQNYLVTSNGVSFLFEGLENAFCESDEPEVKVTNLTTKNTLPCVCFED
jgi:hypothetical protein